MRTWTITAEMKTGEEKKVVVEADTAPQAKEIFRRRFEVQYMKESRPYNASTDARIEKIGAAQTVCHCQREPSKIWLCCLQQGSTCGCQKPDAK